MYERRNVGDAVQAEIFLLQSASLPVRLSSGTTQNIFISTICNVYIMIVISLMKNMRKINK